MHYSRRNVLSGITLGSGSVLLSPILKSLSANAAGVTSIPKRFVFIVKSSGIDKPNLVPGGLPAYEGHRDKPVSVSLADLELPEIFRPLAPMKDKLTIIQGLSGVNLKGNHTAGFGTLSGNSSELSPIGPSVDALLGLHHSQGPYPMFGFATNGVLRGQASVPSDAYVYPTMSAYKRGQSVAYQGSPTKAFNEIFGVASLSDKALKNDAVIKRNVMEFLKEDAGRIRKRLPAEDKETFDSYVDTFESLKVREQKKAALKERATANMPKYDEEQYTRMQHMPRMEAQLEIGAAALIAGLTNVVSYRLDTLGTMYQDLGIGSMGLHAIGHGGTSNGFTSVQMRKMIDAYHISLTAKFAQKLQGIREGDGTMLDNTMIVYLSCTGGKHHGGNSDWPAVLVGGMGGAMKMGQYIEYPSYQQPGHKPLSALHLSLMAASGMKAPTYFGQKDPGLRDFEINGPLPELMA